MLSNLHIPAYCDVYGCTLSRTATMRSSLRLTGCLCIHVRFCFSTLHAGGYGVDDGDGRFTTATVSVLRNSIGVLVSLAHSRTFHRHFMAMCYCSLSWMCGLVLVCVRASATVLAGHTRIRSHPHLHTDPNRTRTVCRGMVDEWMNGVYMISMYSYTGSIYMYEYIHFLKKD